MINEIPLDIKFRRNLQKHFVKISLEFSIQIQLLSYIENEAYSLKPLFDLRDKPKKKDK